MFLHQAEVKSKIEGYGQIPYEKAHLTILNIPSTERRVLRRNELCVRSFVLSCVCVRSFLQN